MLEVRCGRRRRSRCRSRCSSPTVLDGWMPRLFDTEPFLPEHLDMVDRRERRRPQRSIIICGSLGTVRSPGSPPSRRIPARTSCHLVRDHVHLTGKT
jgi:hypothetical protein